MRNEFFCFFLHKKLSAANKQTHNMRRCDKSYWNDTMILCVNDRLCCRFQGKYVIMCRWYASIETRRSKIVRQLQQQQQRKKKNDYCQQITKWRVVDAIIIYTRTAGAHTSSDKKPSNRRDEYELKTETDREAGDWNWNWISSFCVVVAMFIARNASRFHSKNSVLRWSSRSLSELCVNVKLIKRFQWYTNRSLTINLRS